MIYFDNAATSFPKPKAVYEATMDCMMHYAANPGRSGHQMALRLDRAIYDVRRKLTRFIGGEEVMHTIFTYNGTDSLNIAIKGLAPMHGHVVTTSMEHNSVLRPLYELERQGYITLTVVSGRLDGVVRATDIINALRDDTGMVVMTMMSNACGSIMDVTTVGEELKKRGIIFIVDAAQAIGVLDIDLSVLPVDVLCFPCHKGLFSPMGLGALHFKSEVLFRTIREGGTGSFSHRLEQPDIYPDRLESGTPNAPAIIGLGAGLDFIEKEGLSALREKEEFLKNHFIEKLMDIQGVKVYGPMNDRHGPVVSLNVKKMDSAQVAYHLSEEYEIFTRPGLHCAPLAHRTLETLDQGMVRFSFGFFNDTFEVDRAVQAINNLARE